MRRTYRLRKHICGEFMEVEIFPVYAKAKGRGKRKNATSEIQQRLNRRHAADSLRRLLHTNFTESDLFVTLTFNDDNLPASVEDAQRLLQNFLRRLKRQYKRMGVELKYIHVLEYGEKHNRLHIHLIINSGISRGELVKLWRMGAVSSDSLRFEKDGLAHLAKYLTKGGETAKRTTWKRWSGSRNLEKPAVTEIESRLSHRKMTDLCQNGGDANYLETQFDGYEMADYTVEVREDIYGGYYLAATLKKITTRQTAWSDIWGLPYG